MFTGQQLHSDNDHLPPPPPPFPSSTPRSPTQPGFQASRGDPDRRVSTLDIPFLLSLWLPGNSICLFAYAEMEMRSCNLAVAKRSHTWIKIAPWIESTRKAKKRDFLEKVQERERERDVQYRKDAIFKLQGHSMTNYTRDVVLVCIRELRNCKVQLRCITSHEVNKQYATWRI